MQYKVRYTAATYSGVRQVTAEDAEEAIAKVKAWVRKQMTLPMYSDSYSIVSTEDIEEYDHCE